MRTKETIILLFVITTILTGCKLVDEPIGIEVTRRRQPQMTPSPAATDESVERRFTETETESTDAVQSALMWSQRYDELLTNTEKLRETKNTLSVENADLRYKLAEMKTELDQTKAELAQANDFLHEMQMELTKWKSDVLGFRDEMRKAQAAQLEALQRVLRVLGAEFVESTEPQTQPDQGTE
jgi:chromosome segregation ATPase